jgi:hypothetical protein
MTERWERFTAEEWAALAKGALRVALAEGLSLDLWEAYCTNAGARYAQSSDATEAMCAVPYLVAGRATDQLAQLVNKFPEKHDEILTESLFAYDRSWGVAALKNVLRKPHNEWNYPHFLTYRRLVNEGVLQETAELKEQHLYQLACVEAP